jgi:hypothetical protein
MTLKQWLDNRWLKAHTTSTKEIKNLFQIVERDVIDSRSGVSADWRFGIAYNAALKLCTILLYAEGYKAERNLQHYRTIQALPKILGPEKSADAGYLDACRTKRNMAEYDSVGVVSKRDADELIDFVVSLKEEVLAFLKTNHSELL